MQAGDTRDPIREMTRSRRQNWNTHVARHALMCPDAVAMRYLGRSITWSQLHRRVTALAAALSRRGVVAGDRVLIEMLNRPEFVESFLAVTLLGAIAVPCNFRLTATEVEYLAADCDAGVAITDDALVGILLAVRENRDRLDIIVTGESTDPRVLAYEDLVAESGDFHPHADVATDDAALIMYTSGTTGKPKGAVLSHLNLMSQAMNMLIVNGGADVANDVNFIGVPMFHIAGIGSMFTGLLLGIPTVVHPVGAFDADALLDVVASERVSSLFLVPAQWQAVCDAQRARPRAVCLRVLSWGAAPASETLLRLIAETFPDTKILAAFGQTEMSPVTCVLMAEDAARNIGSVGRVIPTVSARVVDENMNDVGVGHVGEIVYRGPTLMVGYWNNPDADAEAFTGGWFHSGDLVRQDEDGYVWVVDRKKDMLVSGGENVYCPEVENVLHSHPDIAEVAVIGRADEKWGEVPVAVVVLAKQGAELADLDDFLTARLARYKHPKCVEVVEFLPRNPAGKVLKGPLRAQFGRETPA